MRQLILEFENEEIRTKLIQRLNDIELDYYKTVIDHVTEDLIQKTFLRIQQKELPIEVKSNLYNYLGEKIIEKFGKPAIYGLPNFELIINELNKKTPYSYKEMNLVRRMTNC